MYVSFYMCLSPRNTGQEGKSSALLKQNVRMGHTENAGSWRLTGADDASLTLDIFSQSEFPSLSGVPQQSQPQTPGQAIWANASQRATQQAHVKRQPQQPGTSQAPSRVSQTQILPSQQQPHTSHDDLFPSAAQFTSQLDDFRNGGQGIGGQLSRGNQPQTGDIDEFPPLGRNAPADIG